MQSFLLSRSTKLLLVVILICACLSTNHAHASQAPPASYWMADIKRQGTVAYGNNTSNYTIFRNVKDFGAKGKYQASVLCCPLLADMGGLQAMAKPTIRPLSRRQSRQETDVVLAMDARAPPLRLPSFTSQLAPMS